MIDIQNKSVYLAAPKRLLTSDMYSRASKFIMEMKPLGLLNARGLFESNQTWFDNFESVISSCNVMIVVSDNTIVGKGVYTEYQFFKDRRCPVYHYIETGGIKTLIEIKKLLVINENDWIDYAVIKYN